MRAMAAHASMSGAGAPNMRRKGARMGEFEAVGDAVTGGMLAPRGRAAAGEARDGHTHETNCLNCGTALAGPYCHACGQKAHVHRSLARLLPRFPAGVLNFEGKIWRTLPMLAWRPGELTRRYIDGERARFVSPIALFLFTRLPDVRGAPARRADRPALDQDHAVGDQDLPFH